MYHVVHVSASCHVPVAITSLTRVFRRRRRSAIIEILDCPWSPPAESEYNLPKVGWEVSLTPAPIVVGRRVDQGSQAVINIRSVDHQNH